MEYKTDIELKPDEISKILLYTTAVFTGYAAGVTPETAIDDLNKVDQASFEDLTLVIIEDPSLKPRELHDKWVVTTKKMIEDGALDDKNIARLEPYMIPFSELPLNIQTIYRLQVQLTRTLLRHNRNGERNTKRQRQRERQRERISSGSVGVSQGGVSGRPT